MTNYKPIAVSKPCLMRETSSGTELIPMECQLLTQRKILINGPITSESADIFLMEMFHLMQTDEPISIYINSPGGEVNAGLVMYDLIQSCPNELNMYCTGIAHSMAGVLLAAGQRSRRFILPHSNVMIHEVLLDGRIGGSATSISRISDSIMETKSLINEILAKHTGKTVREIDKATSFDNFMNAEQAIDFGLCDAVVDFFQIERGNK